MPLEKLTLKQLEVDDSEIDEFDVSNNKEITRKSKKLKGQNLSKSRNLKGEKLFKS